MDTGDRMTRSTTSIAVTQSIALIGLNGHLVEVETHVGRGLVAFTLVGLPDTSLRESKDRVRSALQSCGLEVLDRRITVNLSPAGLPKSGAGFDVAIAVSVLMASGKINARCVDDTVFIGELRLDGTMHAVRGILPALNAAKRFGIKRAVVPAECLTEAQLVRGIDILPFSHLADFVSFAGGQASRALAVGSSRNTAQTHQHPDKGHQQYLGDLRDVRGQQGAIDALTVAAAGGHHLFLIGAPGSGKTMLACRLATILPPLDEETAVTVTALHSIAGQFDSSQGLITHPPLQRPHHSATMASIVGGGGHTITPGAISLAHGGVLFLDEAAEFSSHVLDALRQPLEEGRVSIHRVKSHAQFPARFQLVLAANPCPCGGGNHRTPCTCSSATKRRYISKLSGPLLDRIDITCEMQAPSRASLRQDPLHSSADVRQKVEEARARSAHRLRDTPWSLNAHLPGRWIREQSGIAPTVIARLDRAVDEGMLTMRGADRVLRLMWTLSDLAGKSTPDMSNVAQALALRTGGHYDN